MELTVKVPDMTCDHCKMSIDSSIRKLENIDNVEIDLESKKVEVSGNADTQDILSAIREAGYKVEQILSVK